MARKKKIELKKGTDAHTIVLNLLRLGVDSDTIRKAAGQTRQCIAAIKAHDTMGKY